MCKQGDRGGACKRKMGALFMLIGVHLATNVLIRVYTIKGVSWTPMTLPWAHPCHIYENSGTQ